MAISRIHSIARVENVQGLLLPLSQQQLCEQLGVNCWAANQLYLAGFLSLNPEAVEALDERQEVELRFVDALVANFVPSGSGSSTFNFYGGVLRAGAATGLNFLAGLTAANVLAGVVIDTGTNTIDIAQALSDGGMGGALTKNSNGTLLLKGVSRRLVNLRFSMSAYPNPSARLRRGGPVADCRGLEIPQPARYAPLCKPPIRAG